MMEFKKNNFAKIIVERQFEMDLIRELNNISINEKKINDTKQIVDDSDCEKLETRSNCSHDSRISYGSQINNISDNSTDADNSDYKLEIMTSGIYENYSIFNLENIISGNYDLDLNIGYEENLSDKLNTFAVEYLSSIDNLFYLKLITEVPTYGFNHLEYLIIDSVNINKTIDYLPPNLIYIDLSGCYYSGPEHSECQFLCVQDVLYFDLTKFTNVEKLFMQNVDRYEINPINKVKYLNVSYVPVIDMLYFPKLIELNIAHCESRCSRHITIVKNIPRRDFSFDFKKSRFPKYIIVNDLWWTTELQERIEFEDSDFEND